MANHKSAEKSIRQTEKRNEINKARRGKLKTFIKKIEEAILGGNKDTASAAFKEAQPVIMSSSQKGIIHKNTVARKLSRLSARIKNMGA